jgi:protein TonB
MVKSGKAAGAQSKAASSDAPAPSLIGLAAPGAMAPPDLGPNASSAFKPTLQTLNISQGVSQGLLIRKISPTYPANALRMHIEGSVELLATVSKEGNISHIKVLSGDAQLTRAASEAVKQWKYKPYLLNGEPVDIQTQVTINFRLPK